MNLFFGFAAIYMVFSYIQFLIALCVQLPMGFKIKNLKLLCWDISYVNDKYVRTNRSFTLFCHHEFMKVGLTDKEDMLATAINMIVETIVTAVIFFFSFNWAKEYFDFWEDDIYTFVMGIAVGVVFQMAVKWCMYIWFLATKDKQLIYFMKDKANQCQRGYDFATMDLPELERLDLKSTKLHRLNYQCMRYEQKLINEAYDELAPIVAWFENNFEMDFVKHETPGYANVVFYYSYINPNYEKAIKYYNVAREELENDVDSNGRRVLAYYQLYVIKNPALARETAMAGINVLDKGMALDIERRLEEKLLNKLLEIIKSMEQVASEATN